MLLLWRARERGSASGLTGGIGLFSVERPPRIFKRARKTACLVQTLRLPDSGRIGSVCFVKCDLPSEMLAVKYVLGMFVPIPWMHVCNIFCGNVEMFIIA